MGEYFETLPVIWALLLVCALAVVKGNIPKNNAEVKPNGKIIERINRVFINLCFSEIKQIKLFLEMSVAIADF
jgi:hypothetical protein